MPESIGKRQRGAESTVARDENEPPTKRPRETHGGRDSRRSEYGRRSHSPDRPDRRRDRSRSRDRPREGRRDRRKDRETEPRNHRSRSRDGQRYRRDSPRKRPRSRSRSPQRTNRRGNRSPPPREAKAEVQDQKPGIVPVKNGQNQEPAAAPHSEDDAETAMMRRMMGFAGFRSTKNTKVPGNNVGTVRKDKQTTYRQYMNRVGGFNRPLSPSR